MITNCLIRLYCGMVYRLDVIMMKPTKSGNRAVVHWETPPGMESPEDTLKELLDSIRQRVSALKDTVDEHSKLIEDDLTQLERAALTKQTAPDGTSS